MIKPEKCQRQRTQNHERYWWSCTYCERTWNERNTGSHYRPYECPDRGDKENEMQAQSYRDKSNHNHNDN